MIKVLHNSSCSKSRGILELLDENGVYFEIIDIINNPLSELELKTVLKKLGKSAKEITRSFDPAYKEKFGMKEQSEEEIFQILLENPNFIQRPILIKGSLAMIGRPIENVRYFISE
jgi:arsenate reductase